MKKNLCEVAVMVSKYFLYGFLIQFIAFNTLLGKSGEAQLNTPIHANLQNVSVRQVFDILKKNAHLTFVYDGSDINCSQKIDISRDGLSAGYILDELAARLNLSYKKIGNTITVKKNTAGKAADSYSLPAIPVAGSKQLTIGHIAPFQLVLRSHVSGKVTDSSGNPLIGVTVQVKGTSKGASTDAQGYYSLVASKNDTLVFSYVGYDSKDIAIDGREQINVVLETSTSGLGEVVVVGFGKQKKIDMVSAVSTITTKDLNNNPVSNMENMLQGKIAGVLAIQRSGEPGYDDPVFWIRGISSFAGGTSPLIVVDGVPRNSFRDIDPNEVASLSILKDATATAIYGAKGANGVILITTKRGSISKTRISYRGEYSYKMPLNMPEFLGSADYLSLYNEALKNEGLQPQFSDSLINLYRNNVDPDLYPNNYWLKLLLRNHTSSTTHNLTFQGGTKKTRYFVSGSYYHESGIFKQNPLAEYNNNIGLSRYNLRSNIDINVSPTTLLSVDLAGQYLETNYPGNPTSAILQDMTRNAPYLYPHIFSNGKLSSSKTPNNNRQNPWNMLMESGYSKEYRTSLESLVKLNQDLSGILKGLSAKVKISFSFDGDFYMTRTKDIATYFASGRDSSGNLILNKAKNGSGNLSAPSHSNTAQKSIYSEASLNYARTFNDIHDVSALLLIHSRTSQTQNTIGLPFRERGYVGRLTYSYGHRYSMEANFGLTGSENFAKGHRYGFFPSFGVAWNVTNEPYYPAALKNVLSRLKFRFTMGKTGNDETGGDRFLYRGTFQNAAGYYWGYGLNSPLNQIGGLTEGLFSAPDLKWEIQNEKNYGIDLGLLKGLFHLSANYFTSIRSDILLQRRTVSAVAGFRQAPWQNFGKVSNHGIDLTLDINKQIGNYSTLTFKGNFTYAHNKVLEYDEIPNKYPWMNITGASIGKPNIYIAEGLYTYDDFDKKNGQYTLKADMPVPKISGTVMPGDIKYKDLNGDGVIDEYDQTRRYTDAYPQNPEINYGFGINYAYKGFYAGVYFIGVAKTSAFLNQYNQGFIPFVWGLQESSVRKAVESRWTQENPSQNVLYPRIHSGRFYHNSVPSTWWMRDASFLRLKNASIGYNFSPKVLKRWTGRDLKVRVYLLGYNLLTWSPIKLWDPEAGGVSSGFSYPQSRSFTLGIQINL